MSRLKAAQYGVVHSQNSSGLVHTGRALIWSLNFNGSSGVNVWDSLSGGGALAWSFAADGSAGYAPKFIMFPQGMPMDIGIWITGEMRLTYTILP